MDQRTATFQQHRPRLFGIAYRMLGPPAADLTFSIAQINAWNRLGVAMRSPVARRMMAVRAQAPA
jgi:hypothetical protein